MYRDLAPGDKARARHSRCRRRFKAPGALTHHSELPSRAEGVVGVLPAAAEAKDEGAMSRRYQEWREMEDGV